MRGMTSSSRYADRTVGDLATTLPTALRVFEYFGIDYCCGGKRPLREACERSGVALDAVVEALERPTPGAPLELDWRGEPTTKLVAFIVDTHHAFTREVLVRIDQLLRKVRAVHGERHPELHTIGTVFARLRDELETHLVKEERILFPRILEALAAGAPPGVEAPIARMEVEHDEAGSALRELRQLSNGYEPPEDACRSYRGLFAALLELEVDLHRHIHLESNVLFPRALAAAVAASK